MNIKVSRYLYDKCRTFAEERIRNSKNLYAYRGATSEAKMIEDTTIGTVAEWAVYKYLKSLDCKCSKPDMKHYNVRNKSFSADLKTDRGLIHVKSQGIVSANKYGASWLFQMQDKIFKDQESSDLLAFCLVDGRDVQIQAIVSVGDIVSNDLLDEPKVWRFKDNKRAIYLDSVLKSNIDKWRIK